MTQPRQARSGNVDEIIKQFDKHKDDHLDWKGFCDLLKAFGFTDVRDKHFKNCGGIPDDPSSKISIQSIKTILSMVAEESDCELNHSKTSLPDYFDARGIILGDPQAVFRNFDVNNDGKLTKLEFINMINAIYTSSIKRNNDDDAKSPDESELICKTFLMIAKDLVLDYSENVHNLHLELKQFADLPRKKDFLKLIEDIFRDDNDVQLQNKQLIPDELIQSTPQNINKEVTKIFYEYLTVNQDKNNKKQIQNARMTVGLLWEWIQSYGIIAVLENDILKTENIMYINKHQTDDIMQKEAQDALMKACDFERLWHEEQADCNRSKLMIDEMKKDIKSLKNDLKKAQKERKEYQIYNKQIFSQNKKAPLAQAKNDVQQQHQQQANNDSNKILRDRSYKDIVRTSSVGTNDILNRMPSTASCNDNEENYMMGYETLKKIKDEYNDMKIEQKLSKNENEDFKEMEIENKSLKSQIEEFKKKNIDIDISKYKKWSTSDLIMWVLSLDDGKFNKYEDVLNLNLNEEKVEGEDLDRVNETDIKQWGIKKLSHQKDLFHHIQQLTESNNKNKNEGTAHM